MSDRKLYPLIIFEGPDCGGKSTVMHELTKVLRDDYATVHHGPFPGISSEQLPRFYVESMFGLFEGRHALAMDRCWLSEPIYGEVFRNGQNRIDIAEQRHLERMAMRHGAVVVLCLPPWEAVKAKWLERKGADSDAEYLDRLEQLEQVYERYARIEERTELPVVRYDYTRHKHQLSLLAGRVFEASTGVHSKGWLRTAGSAKPKVILVGEKPSNPTSRDTMWQFPFCSFGSGSSTWLTQHLHEAGIRERDIHWINADQGLFVLKDLWSVPIIALGNVAAAAVEKEVGRPAEHVVPHPQYHRRFKSSEPYPLAALIQSITK